MERGKAPIPSGEAGRSREPPKEKREPLRPPAA